MEVQEKQVEARDGRYYLLRAPRVQDARQLLDFLKATALETNFLLREPEEVETDVQQEELFVQNSIQSSDSAMIVAEWGEKLVGTCSVSPVGNRIRLKHRCCLAIALLKDHWGLGIGSAMMAELLELAWALGYEQVELEVNSRNLRAVKLYQKFGFVSYGRQYRAMKQKDGSYDDLVLMVKVL